MFSESDVVLIYSILLRDDKTEKNFFEKNQKNELYSPSKPKLHFCEFCRKMNIICRVNQNSEILHFVKK